MSLGLDAAASKLSETLKCLAGTTRLDDPKVAQLLVHWAKKSNTKKVLEEVALDALGDFLRNLRQTAVQEYAKELLPAEGVCSLVVTLGAPKRAFRDMSEYFKTRKQPFEAKTGLRFMSPLCTRTAFEAMWVKLLDPLKLDKPLHTETDLSGPIVSRSWPIVEWAKYVAGTPALAKEIDWSLPLLFIVRGDGYPTAGVSWTNLVISLANFGERARTPGFLWVLGLAAGAEKEVDCLATLWASNVQVRVPCNICTTFMINICNIRATYAQRARPLRAYVAHMSQNVVHICCTYVAPNLCRPYSGFSTARRSTGRARGRWLRTCRLGGTSPLCGASWG